MICVQYSLAENFRNTNHIFS